MTGTEEGVVGDRDYRASLEKLGLTEGRHTPVERLVVVTARNVPDGAFVFAGTGLPLLACLLAQRTSAPASVVVLEAGIVDPRLDRLPIATSDPWAGRRASTAGSPLDAFATAAQRGYCTVGLVEASECDMYGNLGGTAAGSYWSGGASRLAREQFPILAAGATSDIASLADSMIVMMPHELRRFPKRLGHIVAVAGRRGPDGESRWDYGLTRGGRVTVVTNLCVLRSDQETGHLEVDGVYPGTNLRDVVENTGWDLDTSHARTAVDPTYAELKVLRTAIDHDRIYLDRQLKRD